MVVEGKYTVDESSILGEEKSSQSEVEEGVVMRRDDGEGGWYYCLTSPWKK